MNLPNSTLEVTAPKYYYRLRECGTRFIADGVQPKSFCSDLDFKSEDLLESKDAAEERYWKKVQIGDSASKLNLILVEEFGDKDFIVEHYLLGEDGETKTINEGQEYELMVLKGKGFTPDPKYVSC